jgi:LmbE family N-acetylglucosaminyl deacetylase
MEKVLVIAPHADDEIIGCGASIAKHVLKGDEVNIIIATNASIGAPELFSQEYIEKIREEALMAHKYLGVKNTFFLDFPAPALNAFPEYKISISFSEIIKNIQPTILYIPHPGDIHQDHKAIYRSALVSARPQGDNIIHSIFCYETLSETEWSPSQENFFIPNCYIDVSNAFNLKLEALSCFKSQLKRYPHPRSLEAIKALSMYRGATINAFHAEAFIIERQIIW